MNIDLPNTTASKINTALLDGRRRFGSATYSAVLTLVVVTSEHDNYDALKAATDAAREHPARILSVIGREGRGEARLDAEVRTMGESGPGEVVILRLHGELADHADAVVLPLLLPDAPVVTWWPGIAPDVPAEHPLGALAARRVTDAAAAAQPLAELAKRADGYRSGDTDLSWTRITPWRTLLAAALDEPFDAVTSIVIGSEPESPSAELLGGWLGWRLDAPVTRQVDTGPGITLVQLTTASGDIVISRPDGRLARLTRPGWPERPVALKRRSTAELLAEELRRMDEDDIYRETIQRVGRAQLVR